jgi:hypothetical protein
MSGNSKRLLSIVLALTLGVALAAAARASGNTPAGYTAAQWRAEQVRSQGLDRKYDLGVPPRAWLKALRIRSEALNRKYHLGRSALASTAVRATPGFHWGDAGIGAGVALGALLVGAAVVTGARRHPRTLSRG